MPSRSLIASLSTPILLLSFAVARAEEPFETPIDELLETLPPPPPSPSLEPPDPPSASQLVEEVDDYSSRFRAQMEFRSKYDFSDDPILVAAILRDPPSNPSEDQLGVALTDAEWTDLSNRERVGEDAYLIRDYAMANYPDEFGGLYLDQMDGGLIKVGFTANLDGHFSRIRDVFPFPEWVRVVPMRKTYNQLLAAQDAIEMSTDSLALAGVHVLMTGINEQRNAVNVGLRDPTAHKISLIQDLVGDVPLAVEMVDRVSRIHSGEKRRVQTYPQLRGGIEVVSRLSDPNYPKEYACTLGFNSYKPGGERWSLTAGHCQIWPYGQVHWFQSGFEHSGSRRISAFPVTYVAHGGSADVAAFQLADPNLYQNWLLGKNGDIAIHSYQRASQDREGQTVCKVGVRTGLKCGPLRDRNVKWKDEDGRKFWAFRKLDLEVKRTDSGGPTWYGEKAFGLLSAQCEKECLPYSHILNNLVALTGGLLVGTG